MQRRLTLIGWAAFGGSGVLYLVSGIRSGDGWVVAGSIVWLAAVGVFVTALLLRK